MRKKIRLLNVGTWKFLKKTLFYVPSKLESLVQHLHRSKQKISPLEEETKKAEAENPPLQVPPDALTLFPKPRTTDYEVSFAAYHQATPTDVGITVYHHTDTVTAVPEETTYAPSDFAPHNFDTQSVTTNVYLKKVTENTEPVRILNRRWEAPKDDFIEDVRERLPVAMRRTEQKLYDTRIEQMKSTRTGHKYRTKNTG